MRIFLLLLMQFGTAFVWEVQDKYLHLMYGYMEEIIENIPELNKCLLNFRAQKEEFEECLIRIEEDVEDIESYTPDIVHAIHDDNSNTQSQLKAMPLMAENNTKQNISFTSNILSSPVTYSSLLNSSTLKIKKKLKKPIKMTFNSKPGRRRMENYDQQESECEDLISPPECLFQLGNNFHCQSKKKEEVFDLVSQLDVEANKALCEENTLLSEFMEKKLLDTLCFLTAIRNSLECLGTFVIQQVQETEDPCKNLEEELDCSTEFDLNSTEANCDKSYFVRMFNIQWDGIVMKMYPECLERNESDDVTAEENSEEISTENYVDDVVPGTNLSTETASTARRNTRDVPSGNPTTSPHNELLKQWLLSMVMLFVIVGLQSSF